MENLKVPIFNRTFVANNQKEMIITLKLIYEYDNE